MTHPDEQFEEYKDCPEKAYPEPDRYRKDVHELREEYAAILIKELAHWLAEGGLIMVSGTPHYRSQALPLMADQLAKDVIKLREQPE